MTAQTLDKVVFKGEEYSLIGISGGKLVTLEEFGIKTRCCISTGCYRGFYVGYEIKEEVMYLRELIIDGPMHDYKPIYGVKPKKNRYRGLNKMIPFTGKMRIAKNFINEHYVHMGFQKATAFKTVLDITLKEGRVTETKDISSEIRSKQGEFKKAYEAGDMGIRDAFKLDMDIK